MVDSISPENGMVLEGSWEEIVARSSEFRGRRIRLIVLPSGPPETEPSLNGQPVTLADLLSRYIGGLHGGGEAWSERAGERFADHLTEKRERGDL